MTSTLQPLIAATATDCTDIPTSFGLLRLASTI